MFEKNRIELPVMLSLREASAQTGLAYNTLRRYCITGKIRYVKAGRGWLVNMASLAQYLNAGETYNA